MFHFQPPLQLHGCPGSSEAGLLPPWVGGQAGWGNGLAVLLGRRCELSGEARENQNRRHVT